MKDHPKTKLFGLELKPWAPGQEPGSRRGYLKPKDVERLSKMDPKEYWSTYNDPDKVGLYAGSVPHVVIHTQEGHVPAKYLTKMAAFAEELVKLGFKATTKPMKAMATAQAHFEAQDKDWKAFEKHLRSPEFRKAIGRAEEADPTLKKYVKTFGEYQGSKDELARIKSKDSGRTYIIKALPNGRWGCNCGDWQFKHSIQGGMCKHIKSVKQSKMVKISHPLGVGFTMTRRTEKLHRKGNELESLRRGFHGGKLPEEKDRLLSGLPLIGRR
jgi:hypothetical protein